MRFTKSLPFKKVAGLLDSEKSVREMRISLKKNTENAYREFERAKRFTQEEANKKLLD